MLNLLAQGSETLSGFGADGYGTSVNPARALAPAVFTGGEALAQVWLFIVAPLVGGAIAAVFHRAWFSVKED